MNRQPTAIVVDDSKTFLMYLSILLKRMNLEVLPATSVEEALELARVTRPNLMTLDMVMPEMDGLEALRIIRQDKDLSDLPVIMISSHRDSGRHSEACALGCIDVLDKPIELRRLHNALQSCNLYNGGRRRYLRTQYEETVELKADDQTFSLPCSTLSERGLYINTSNLLRRGMTVQLCLPLPCHETLQLRGRVIYTKSDRGGHFFTPQGMAIKFEHLTTRDMELLGESVTEILVGDIVRQYGEVAVCLH